MELTVADVDGNDAGGTVLEQAIGAAAGGRTDVEAVASGWGDGPGGEGGAELVAAAGDVAGSGSNGEFGVGGEAQAGLGDAAAGGVDASGEDQGGGFGR